MSRITARKTPAKRPMRFLNRLIFFIGWLLSPVTFWNDAFVNIPLAYVSASAFVRIIPADFLLAVLSFYWLSNVLGLLMMYVSGKRVMIGDKADIVRELGKMFLTILVYSLILALLYKFNILKPIQLSGI